MSDQHQGKEKTSLRAGFSLDTYTYYSLLGLR